MELNEFLTLTGRKKQTIVFWLFLFLILAIILTFIQPFRHGSSANLLVIQNFSENTDPYTTSKSNEYLSNILAKVIYSNSFYNKVLESGYKIDKSYFKGDISQQMKKWGKTISAKAVNDTGIISLNVYHTDKLQAEQIARAISYTLQTKHSLYHGNGNNVVIKVIDEPITSNFPVKPNIILNFSLSIILGLVFSLFYIYLLPEKKYNLRLIPKFKKIRKSGKTLFDSPMVEGPLVEEPSGQMADNWQAVGQILGSEFKPQVLEPVEEQINFDNENNNITGAEEIREDVDYNVYNNYEDIVKQGSMNNVFGKPNLEG